MKLLTALSLLTSVLSAQAPQQKAPLAPRLREVTVTGIPGIVAAGAQWLQIWQSTGNNGDGLLGAPDGSLLVAQNDLSQVLKIDTNNRASVYLTDTHTAGSLSLDAQGRLLSVQRAVPMAVAYLAPEKKILADTYQGKPLGDLGRLNDLVADRRGGAYFTVGGAYYASPTGQVTSLGENIRANGIMLSPDDKTLYVTNREVILAFDVQPDGSVTNRRDFGKLEAGGGGDGLAVDSEGRLYVSSGPGIQILSKEGKYLGLIPTPRNVISTAFAGTGKKWLHIVCSGALDPEGKEMPGTNATIYKISMLSQGFPGRAK